MNETTVILRLFSDKSETPALYTFEVYTAYDPTVVARIHLGLLLSVAGEQEEKT